MIRTYLIFFFLIQSVISFGQNKIQFITTDIDNFWFAYEKINSTKDSVLQLKLLKELYIDKGTQGLKNLIEARNYTDVEFIDWITKYPIFWNTLKPKTLFRNDVIPKIESNIEKLKNVYKDLKYYPIYFSVGAFRTNGTILNNSVLLGAEMTLADSLTIITEFPLWRQAYYKEYNPRNYLPFLCTHEYVHTQQKEMVFNLLSQCLYEGVAEFITCKATDTKSFLPAIEYGKKNLKKVVDKFTFDMFTQHRNDNWLWGENRNDLKIRDLGYFIGYEICERYYNLSSNKQKAIKDLIELDYTNEKEVERIIEMTKLLPKTIDNLYKDFQNRRPTVVSISQFKNGSKKVNPNLQKITINFSQSLLKGPTSVDYGPLGKKYFPKISIENRKFSEDGKSWTIEVELEPNKRYQILIQNNFQLADGVGLKEFLIDFTTTK
jgi:hypothetical protein